MTAWRGLPSPLRPTQGPGSLRELDLCCPRDGTRFAFAVDEGIAVFRCATCRGTWLPRKYLRAITGTRVFSHEAFERTLTAAWSAPSSRLCPAGCGSLREIAWYEASLSWCPACKGAWLDGGELAVLVARMPPLEGPYVPDEGDAGRYVPYRLHPDAETYYAIAAWLLLAYGAVALLIDDLYLPGRYGRGVHLHGVPMWTFVGGMAMTSAMMASVVVDRYDERSNEPRYLAFARWTRRGALILYVAAFALDLVVYRSSSAFAGR